MSTRDIPLGDLLRIDRQQGQLLCAETVVDLKRKAFDVLCVLAQSPGRVVSKDELLSRVWPGAVVEENNLQVHVSALRKVLERHAAGTVELVTVPGKGYKLVLAPAPPALPHGARRRGPVLAVLPFDTFGAGDVAVLAQGTSEEIGLALSRVRWLSVIGSSSVAAAYSREGDARAVARSFDADYVVQGSVRRDGERLRVTARLADASSLAQLWGERYERGVEGIFALQDEIAAAVVSAIEPGIERAELSRIARKPPSDVQAWERTLEAAALLRPLMPQGARHALALLERASHRDPGYAWALALKAWCHHVIFSRGGFEAAHRDAAVADARAAMALGADDPLALATGGLVLWFEAHDLPTAFGLFDRALAISPGNFLALAGSSVALAWSGEPASAADRARHALRLNPFHPLRYLALLGLASSRLQQDDAQGACQAASQAVEANPGFSVPLAYLCAAQARAGDDAGARDSAQRLLQAQPGFTISGFRSVVGVNASVFEPFAKSWLHAGVPA